MKFKARPKPWPAAARKGGRSAPGPKPGPSRAGLAPEPVLPRPAAPAPPPPGAPAGPPLPGDVEKLLALVRERKLRGLKEQDAAPALPLAGAGLAAAAQALEEAGEVLILSFSPLHLVAKDALDHLRDRLVPYVSRFHEAHPLEPGIPLEKIEARFGISERLLILALKTLVHDGRLRQEDGRFALAGFRRRLSPRDEALLEKIESEFAESRPAATIKEIRERASLPATKLEALLGVLVERGRLVAGAEGVYFLKDWLDASIARLRALPKRELSVAEFKSLTGLSRKYAIPLLELLDDMGVTRRDDTGRAIA